MNNVLVFLQLSKIHINQTNATVYIPPFFFFFSRQVTLVKINQPLLIQNNLKHFFSLFLPASSEVQHTLAHDAVCRGQRYSCHLYPNCHTSRSDCREIKLTHKQACSCETTATYLEFLKAQTARERETKSILPSYSYHNGSG